jgi:ABC-type bacteriocin/lantibiotic exporter with double-glycine peptidase domain
MKKIHYIFYLLNISVGKFRFRLLLLFMLVSAFVEMMSIGLLAPIINMFENEFSQFSVAGIVIEKNLNNVLILLFAAFTLKFIILSVLAKYQANLAFDSIRHLSVHLLKFYLYGELKNIYGKNNSEAVRNIFNEVNLFGIGVLLPFSILISEIMVIMLLTFLVYFIAPVFLLILAIAFILYSAIFKFLLSVKTNKVGTLRQESEKDRYSKVYNTLNSAAEVKTGGYEKMVVDDYQLSTEAATKSMELFWLIRQLPKLSIELIIIIGAVFVFYMLGVLYSDTANLTFSQLGVSGVILFRIVPGFIRVNSSWSSIVYNTQVIQTLYDLVSKSKGVCFTKEVKTNNSILFEKYRLVDINWGHLQSDIYSYRQSYVELKSGFNFINGDSGSGKTSLLLGLCGLNNNINFKLKGRVGNKWIDVGKNLIVNNSTYISQDTHLGGITVREAILSSRKLDDKLLKICFKVVTVNNRVSLGLETELRGLSGGQKKRVAIARALYSNKKFILLDESFSGIDDESSKEIINLISGMFSDKVFIVITHNTNIMNDNPSILNIK